MRGVNKCIKFLIFSIILVLSFVLYSENTNALSLSLDVEPTGEVFAPTSWDCMYTSGSYTNNQSNCSLQYTTATQRKSMQAIRSGQSFHFKEGYYYEFLFGFEANRSSRGHMKAITWFPHVLDSDWVLVDYEQITDEESYSAFTNSTPSGTGTSSNSDFSSYSKFFRVVLYSKTDSTRRFIFGNESNTMALIDLDVITYETIANVVVGNIREYQVRQSAADKLNEKDDEDRDNLEQQSSSATSDSDSSAEDAEQTGTTLLGAFSAFVGALTNATPSNCVIDMDLGNLDMGNVDLCDLDPPAGFQAISSVFMIMFCVPLSIATARKVISLFRSFQ